MTRKLDFVINAEKLQIELITKLKVIGFFL